MWLFIIPGAMFYGLGAIMAVVNFYVAGPRYWLFRWRGGQIEDFKSVRGFPATGSLCLYASAFLLFFVNTQFAISALFVSMIDPYALHAIVLNAINHRLSKLLREDL